jgi:hypothetical protein
MVTNHTGKRKNTKPRSIIQITMISIIDKQGKNNSFVRCVKGCGPFGKTLGSDPTQGIVTEENIARLEHTAEYHERHHPSHKIEITYYRVQSLQEVAPVDELPIVAEMRARLKALSSQK